MTLGQIVPFEVRITADSTAPADNGVKFTAGWETRTTSNSNNLFGYDATYQVLCAFVDRTDSAGTTTTATVTQASSSMVGTEIQGQFHVEHLEPGDKAVVEVWVVLQSIVPPAVSGNVASRLISATADSDDDKINTGAQTVPLMRVSGFFTPKLELAKTAIDTAATRSPQLLRARPTATA